MPSDNEKMDGRKSLIYKKSLLRQSASRIIVVILYKLLCIYNNLSYQRILLKALLLWINYHFLL